MVSYLEDRCQSRDDFEVNMVTGERLLFYSDELIRPGYVNMKRDGSSRSSYYAISSVISRHRPALCGDAIRLPSVYDYIRYMTLKTRPMDKVVSIRCKKWPVIAKPWITRRRSSGWPHA